MNKLNLKTVRKGKLDVPLSRRKQTNSFRLCRILAPVVVGIIILAIINPSAIAQRQPPPLVPPSQLPAENIRRSVNAPFLNVEERRALRVFHGLWTRRDLDSPARRAEAALYEFRLSDEALASPSAPVEDRAEALIQIGEMSAAIDLLKTAESVRGCRLLAEALEWKGQFNDADDALESAIKSYRQGEFESAPDLTEVARCLIIRARIRGEPAAYYQQIVGLLSQIDQRIDRLYWPAKLVEAELLLEKDNDEQAIEALHEVIALNPRSSVAWYHLGEIAITSYDFTSADQAATRLEHLNPNHPLAFLLRARSNLAQSLADEAQTQVAAVLKEYPKNRSALALRAAVAAAKFDEPEMRSRLDKFDTVSPNHPYAYFVVGSQLSNDRDYEESANTLNEAIRRQPNWAAPQVKLGLMEMQAGRDDEALHALRRVAQLDPFNKRAAFSLHLLESLQSYEVVEAEHFIIRYDGQTSDGVLAEEMGPLLDRMYEEVTSVFQYEPPTKTIIELLPNHERFAVRITGMPAIHTIAASTGPVIAMESPRTGPNHYGTYDWLRVLRHEFVHTVTLGRTDNRIPHWLTEAAAVWQELAPRTYDTCFALTQAYLADRLFDLNEINWAFVRPKRAGDRSLAYAQSHWMFEFFVKRFGHRKMLDLLDAYRRGLTEEQAILENTGIDRDAFYAAFLEWAGEQIRQWGMMAEPSIEDLMDNLAHVEPSYGKVIAPQAEANAARMNTAIIKRLTLPRVIVDREDIGVEESPRQNKEPDSQATSLDAMRSFFPPLRKIQIPVKVLREKDLESWLREYPGNPDVLSLRLNLATISYSTQSYISRLESYQAARPVDPMPFRVLADLYLKSNEPQNAVPYLEELDRREQSTGAFAAELAGLYRQQKMYARAEAKVQRALIIEPFNAGYRELAAAVALQEKDYAEARHQLVALSRIEPDRPQHTKRLQALNRLEEKNSSRP